MFQCPNCGECYEQESRFCPSCGTKQKVSYEYYSTHPEPMQTNDQRQAQEPRNTAQQNTQPQSRDISNYYPYQSGPFGYNDIRTEDYCPYCGNKDLLYETAQKTTRGSTLYITLSIVFSVIALFCFVTAHPFLAILFAIPLAVFLIVIIIGKIVIMNVGDKDGQLRVTCKRCGKRVR